MSFEHYRIIAGIGIILLGAIGIIYAVECFRLEKDRDRLRRQNEELKRKISYWIEFSALLQKENIMLEKKLDLIRLEAETEHLN